MFLDIYIWRVFPMPPWPLCDAPLLNPIWRLSSPSLALSCSSVKERSFLSAIFGPNAGPVNSGCFWVILARENRHKVTWAMFLLSNKSAVWKISSSGTPYFLMAAWNLKRYWNKMKHGILKFPSEKIFNYLWTFSISWKFVPRSWIFLMHPGVNLLANLQRTIPSFSISS